MPRHRWSIACLLGFGVLVNYFDRVNLSVSHAALYATFGISNITFGYLSGAYNWTYAMCQLPIGVLLDRFGVRRVGRISTLLWSIASFGAAVTPSIPGFFAARLLLGVGESPTFPANAKAIGLWFPSKERSFATSIFDASAKLASAVGVPLIGVLLLKFGWRWSFAATGMVSLVYFALFSKVYRDPNDEPALTERERRYIAEDLQINSAHEPEPSGASLGYLIRQRKVLGMAIGFGAYNYVFYLLLTWLPSYLSAALHIDLLHSFLYTSVPWLFATFTDLMAGLVSDALIQRGWDASRVRKTVLVCGTTFGLGILGAAHAHTAVRALIWISISIGGLAAASPIGWSIPSMIAPRGSVGTVGGIINLSNQLSGIAAPIITGYVVAETKSYSWAFGISAIYLLLGIGSYLFLLGKIEQIAPEPVF
ncbi:MFS transporter [Granulicella mallensis]|uniref:Major facilitator superfamily MFS_1 n=1 Tax=Granulicella mallensis (strain ATCC BAA-1857 / DSM 23137 / MP5ACTX8) TaxID=682795 RepID=G8NX99_GRAMM|nr:MFS transporter [Granulicella mallensis]AEU37806.1 major facilitator superfamily MFS_1 [Granulicella mallensis MP5ACTX8]